MTGADWVSRRTSIRRWVYYCLLTSWDMFVGSAFELNFLPSKLCFSLKSNFEFIFPGTEANPHSMDRRLFSALYCGPKMNLHANRPFFVFFFFNSAAEIMLSMLFNTYLKLKQGNMERGRKERIKQGHSPQDICGGSPILTPARDC